MSREVEYLTTSGRLTIAPGCWALLRYPASLYQDSIGGTMIDAATIPRRAPASIQITIPFIPASSPLRLHDARRTVGQDFRDAGGNFVGVVAHAHDGIGAHLLGVPRH